MRKKIICAIFCAILMFCAMPFSAFADIGPKASVSVDIKGVEGEYYITLLSLYSSTGPQSAYDGTEQSEHVYDESTRHIWQKFVDYKDSDGFYFLQVYEKCTGADTFKWGYYPPRTFKVLLYFPESDTFISSSVCERYAFDSYFLMEVAENGESVSIKKSYDYTWETVSLVARILLTIMLEIAVALLFGYRTGKEILFISAVNAVTQIALNVALNVVNFHSGQWAFTSSYISYEFLVFALEAVLFAFLLPRFAPCKKTKKRAVLYAASANVLSFALGLWLSHIIPGIF